MIKKKDLSQEDKKTWEDYIKDPSGIYDKDVKNQRNIRKERFKFDLHGFTLEEANRNVLRRYEKHDSKSLYLL